MNARGAIVNIKRIVANTKNIDNIMVTAFFIFYLLFLFSSLFHPNC